MPLASGCILGLSDAHIDHAVEVVHEAARATPGWHQTMTGSDRILVTGAKGFLGSNIVSRARVDGRDVVAAYRRAGASGTTSLDVCDPASVDAAFRAVLPSVVIHCAAYGVNYADQDFDSALGVNVHGALCVLAAAARYRVQRFVHIGSCSEYGSKLGPISEEALLAPTSLYGATKAVATLLLVERARALGVPVVIARCFGMWGPGEAAYRLVPQVIAACISRSALKLTPCEVTRDYTYVEDMAANILALALTREVPAATILNMGTGHSILLRDFVLSIARLLDGEGLMQFGALSYRATEMPSLVANVTRMRELLGSGPVTPLVEGVRRMMA